MEEQAKPKKRRRNIINDKKLKDLFIVAKDNLCSEDSFKKFVDDVPKDYDPYHRVKAMKDKDK